MTSLRRLPSGSEPVSPKSQTKSSAKPRAKSRPQGGVDPLRARHLALGMQVVEGPHGRAEVMTDDAESPLGWLARRRGKDGRALIAPHQLLAGERLRADFTRAQMMPRTTSNWDVSAVRGLRSGGLTASDAVIAAQQRLRHALEAVGPEFSGLLLDICCFLKGLEEIERERLWPRASAKVVLALGLDRLARHYGYGGETTGRKNAPMRSWNADTDAASR